MKKTLLSLAMTATLGLVGTSAYAAAINVGGVILDPDSIFDFSTTDTMIETIVSAGDTLSGYGRIDNLNGTPVGTFCPGCELTYTFTGYDAFAVGTGLSFTGGIVDIFVDFTPNFDTMSALSAGDGTLWLSLAGHEYFDILAGVDGTLHSTGTPGPDVTGNGRGYLDVAGGLAEAQAIFNTNTFDLGVDGLADFMFTSSFQLLPGGATFTSDDGREYGLFGSNDFQGDAQISEVPEPGTLGLFGLGMLGLAAARRRKSV